ncbi:hypothetical protein OG389_14965 [Streptomyces sp. NBC_00435]|uniref:hypothetical protein n=1 Tax=Streptomyces sp. NBC_00435 TaxID=2903649 RepID=UPI002E1D75C1
MNDSPGWATPGSSPSDGEGSHGTQPPAPAPQPPGGDPKWSAEQPPPGQWSSPAPGQPPQQPEPARPQQGWGSYGGGYPPQNGGGPPGSWGNQVVAAKPGVIPLRPLGLGEILDGAVATMRKHWRSVLPITLAVSVVVQLATVVMQKYALSDLAIDPARPEIAPEDVFNSLGSGLALTGADLFLQLVGSIVATAMLTMIFSRSVLGQDSSIGAAWRGARSQLLRLAGLTLLLGLGASLLAFVLILPGALLGNIALGAFGGIAGLGLIVWLWIKFSLASPALILEKAPVLKSLARSSKLVKGSWWRVFGITVLTAVITLFVSMIIATPLTIVGATLFGDGLQNLAEGTGTSSWGYLIVTAIGAVLAMTITMPIQSGVTVLLYVDQRIRREALDLELARAAGIENYGAASPPTAG